MFRSLYELHILGVGVTQARRLDDEADVMVRDYIRLAKELTPKQADALSLRFYSAIAINAPDRNGWRGHIEGYPDATAVFGETKGDVLMQLLHELGLLVDRAAA
jgi:hypothetical protein